jgi:hypothetical protein
VQRFTVETALAGAAPPRVKRRDAFVDQPGGPRGQL